MLIIALVQDSSSNQVTTCSVAARQSKRDVPKNRKVMMDEYVSFMCAHHQYMRRNEIIQLMVIQRDKIVHFFSEEDLS